MFAFGLLFAGIGMLVAFVDQHRDVPRWALWMARNFFYTGLVMMAVSVFIMLWWVMP